MRWLDPKEPVRLKAVGGPADQVHAFGKGEVDAINTALAAERPLLVQGEPGIGKSQLARAAAVSLERAFVSFVVDSRTESRDLLWHFDAVARLADAQVLSAARAKAVSQIRADLRVKNYVRPGPLWWAFDWVSATAQAERVGCEAPPNPDGFPAKNGCVLLLDEIDKAESDVPNGLLEALGNGTFLPLGRAEPVRAREDVPPPLVVVTTNEERSLPDPFIRRCAVLNLVFEEDVEFLIKRGRVHFSEDLIDDDVLRQAAALALDDRKRADKDTMRKPGLAEYLDLLRAITKRWRGEKQAQIDALALVRPYVLQKKSGRR